MHAVSLPFRSGRRQVWKIVDQHWVRKRRLSRSCSTSQYGSFCGFSATAELTLIWFRMLTLCMANYLRPCLLINLPCHPTYYNNPQVQVCLSSSLSCLNGTGCLCSTSLAVCGHLSAQSFHILLCNICLGCTCSLSFPSMSHSKLTF